MNKTIKNLRRKALKDFLPVAEDMRGQGVSSAEILITFERYRRTKREQFYKKPDEPLVGIDAKTALEKIKNSDSKAEGIFYDKLSKADIPFQFQYKIGPYRVDFLIAGVIVLECDGPHHQEQRGYDSRRDWYLEGLGYYVVRLSWELIAQIPEVVISELKELIRTKGLENKALKKLTDGIGG